MRRHLWWLVFGGFVGGSYLYLQQPETPGAPAGGTFRWSMLWAPESELPPSDRLSVYMGRTADRVFGPLDAKFEPPPAKEVSALSAKFRREAGQAPQKRLPVYQAAVIVADALAAGLESRHKAMLALASARANTLSFRDPINGGMTTYSSVLQNRTKAAWAAEAALRRERVNQWYAVLQQREHVAGLYGVIGK